MTDTLEADNKLLRDRVDQLEKILRGMRPMVDPIVRNAIDQALYKDEGQRV